MPAIDEMNLEEVETVLAQLRDRRRELKSTGKAALRKISTLERRRQRFMEKVREIDEQIEALRRESSLEQPAPRRRGRRPKSAQLPVG